MKVRATSALTATLVVAGTGIAGQEPFPREALRGSQPATIEAATSHVYKTVGDVQLRLHAFDRRTAKNAAGTPAIVFFFGGSWTVGTVFHFVPQAKHFANRGAVAIVVEYRVFSRHGTSPFDAIEDAKSAIRWVRRHAGDLGIDPNRIVGAGGSAGGHIVLSTAIFDQFDDPREDKRVSSKPDALVLFNPEVDTVDTPEHRTFQDLRDRFGDRGREGSPVHHLRGGLPPTLIMHGTADTLVAYADVARFCTESKELSNRCEVIGYEGAGHSFFNRGKWYDATLQDADRFLTSLGFLRSGTK